jgi:acyl-CoA synthetase (AMP-forming)/AMP-acid ligase II
MAPVHLDALNAPTVAQAFAATAQRWPEAPFLSVLPGTAEAYGVAAGERRYGEFAERVATLRAAYAAAGYGHGHRVGLLLENRPTFFEHWFALNGLGASVVPLNAELRSAELEYLLAHSEVLLVVALQSHHAVLLQAAAVAGCRLQVMADGAPIPTALRAAPLLAEAVGELTEAALLYTSGTTGRPKGCILPNRYFLHAGRWYASIGGLCTLHEGSERMLTPLPLTHMNAMAYSAMAMVMTGGCLIVLDRFHPHTWWADVHAAHATVVHYLGVMPAMLMKAAPSAQERAHRVRFGFGAGVDKSLQAAFEARCGFPLLEAWAMTETGAGAVVIANRAPRDVGSHCFGAEEPEVHVRLVNDSGMEATVDEPGELWVRHAGEDARYGFFAGYLKDEAATVEAWAGGWFHTGDIVRRDAKGELHFIDRRKNVIRRSGENISAVEVESVLNQHPAVRVCAVAAVPDAVRGDEVLACVVLHEPAPVERRAELAYSIVRHALERLAYFKAPGFVAFVEGLPLTASQKIARGELKALALQLPNQAHCVNTCAMKKRPAA